MDDRVRSRSGSIARAVAAVVIGGSLAGCAWPWTTFSGGGGAAGPPPAAGDSADRSVQSDLRFGVAAAKTYFIDRESYAGFDPAAASRVEPSLTWAGPGPASTRGVVRIDLATAAELVLSARSASGRVFCVGDAAALGTVEGTRDGFGLRHAADCGPGAGW
jgi:hypothetical protein